jgi:hypothetical protein
MLSLSCYPNRKSVLQKTNTYLIIILFISFSGWQSCAVNHSNPSTKTDEASISVTPKIIFLNYSIKSDKSKGAPEILFINKVITEGKLKNNYTQPEISRPGDLKCMTLDNQMNPVDSIIVPDPLNVTVESVNENNALFKKEITKDSAQFSIRLQLTENIYSIGIKISTNSGNQNSFLLITKLK